MLCVMFLNDRSGCKAGRGRGERGIKRVWGMSMVRALAGSYFLGRTEAGSLRVVGLAALGRPASITSSLRANSEGRQAPAQRRVVDAAVHVPLLLRRHSPLVPRPGLDKTTDRR